MARRPPTLAPALLAGLALGLGAVSSTALDLGKPDEAYRAMLRIVGDLDGKPVFKDWDVTILAALPNGKPKPILRMQGYNAGRLITRQDGSYDWVSRSALRRRITRGSAPAPGCRG